MTLDESIELWQKEHEHEIVYACNMDTEVQEIVDRVNPWHTGTPTEKGNYLCVFEYSFSPLYGWCIWDGEWGFFSGYDPSVYHVVAWQKIEPPREYDT